MVELDFGDLLGSSLSFLADFNFVIPLLWAEPASILNRTYFELCTLSSLHLGLPAFSRAIAAFGAL